MKQLQLRRAYGLRTASTILRTATSAVFSASLLLVLAAGGAVVSNSGATAKTPGKTYCFKGTCHRVKTITETRREIGKVRVVHASHYDHCSRDRFNPCGLTSSGERFRPNAADNAASPIYPDGTRLLVWNPRNGKTVVVRINNAGPYRGRRKLDLSRGAAEKLGFRRRGVARLHVKVLSAPTRSEARYRRHRRYAPVPGFVGAFRSIDAALLSVSSAISGLFESPVHVAAGRETARQRRIRLAREKRLRRAVARSMRRSRGRRHARLTPPLPISKLALARLPMLQLADVEMGRSRHASIRIVALPTRRPYRPIRIAAAANGRRIAKRVAGRKRKKPARVAVASRRRVAKASTKRKERSKPAKRSSRRDEHRKAKLTRRAKPSLRRAIKKNSQGKRTRLAQLHRKSRNSGARKPVTVKGQRVSVASKAVKRPNKDHDDHHDSHDDNRTRQGQRKSRTSRVPVNNQTRKSVTTAAPQKRDGPASAERKTERPVVRRKSQAWRVAVARGGRE